MKIYVCMVTFNFGFFSVYVSRRLFDSLLYALRCGEIHPERVVGPTPLCWRWGSAGEPVFFREFRLVHHRNVLASRIRSKSEGNSVNFFFPTHNSIRTWLSIISLFFEILTCTLPFRRINVCIPYGNDKVVKIYSFYTIMYVHFLPIIICEVFLLFLPYFAGCYAKIYNRMNVKCQF